jgi:hypothetical protein
VPSGFFVYLRFGRLSVQPSSWIFALGFVHQVAGLIVSTALIDVHFYQFALAEHALCVSADGEGNIPKLQKVVPLRDPRRAQR